MNIDVDIEIKPDELITDLDVQIKHILMQTFMLGLFVGKNQLQDDMDPSPSPLHMGISQIQQTFNQIMPNTADAASSNVFKTMLSKLDDIKKTEEKKEKIANQNLTLNEKKINSQHDAVVKQLMESFEAEARQVAADVVRETKAYKKNK